MIFNTKLILQLLYVNCSDTIYTIYDRDYNKEDETKKKKKKQIMVLHPPLFSACSHCEERWGPGVLVYEIPSPNIQHSMPIGNMGLTLKSCSETDIVV